MINSWISHSFHLTDLLEDLNKQDDPLIRLVGRKVSKLHEAIYALHRHEDRNLTDDELLKAINAFLWADTPQDISVEIAAVADRAKNDIDKLQRLHDDHWG